MSRIASALSDNDEHYHALREILLSMRFMPAGRIQTSVGSSKGTTPYNCFVSGTIGDSYVDGHDSIMSRAHEAAATMRLGGGIGYDFSTLRPRGELIKKLNSRSSGAVSFIDIYDAVGRCTASSGDRRGAEMGVLRIDHPDIEEFIRAKQNSKRFTAFNLSIAVTDEFMTAVKHGSPFDLRWGKKIYRTVEAKTLWEAIMRSTFDWSEPGVLFIDSINKFNNLYYCETIAATNPCGEQPLPPYGACLLGSWNLVKYLRRGGLRQQWEFDYVQLFKDIPHVVRAMDNVVDRAKYPLSEQEDEAKSKRRMGLGVTGLANCIEAMGPLYGSNAFVSSTANILSALKNATYRSSAELAAEKGSFPLYDKERYLSARFVESLSDETRDLIAENGIRNSHLLSIAPTGTISFAADNVSSGIEPVYAYETERTLREFNGVRKVEVQDYGVRFLDTHGKISSKCSVNDHLEVLTIVSYHIDSAVSKTCNVPTNVSWDDFQSVYFKAWEAGCKGCTTHRTGNFRGAVLVSKDNGDEPVSSCEFDPVTGVRSCE
jgi:ribonucleoside-diphosphate reductase alpha chain